MNPRRRSHHPRFLNEVLEAIATLKESKGSTKKNIIDQVELLLSKRIKRLRHDSTQIQRALRHGLSSGLIKSKNGKYVLGMNQKDYGAFKKLQELSSGGDLMRQVRRRKGKKKRKRRPRRRRRYSDVSDTEEDDDNEDYDDDDEEVSRGSDSCASQGNGSLEDRGRRRGKKRRKRKRTKRRRRNEIINIHEGGNKTENLKSNKSSEEDSLKMENNDTDIDDMETNKQSGTPEDRGHRRSRKRKKRKRTRRRRRSDGTMEIQEAVDNTENQKSPKSSDDESAKSRNDGSDIDHRENNKQSGPDNVDNDEEHLDDNHNQNHCEKPDCLCNNWKSHQ
ncbi:uncharacterized protein DDB_G0283697-like isoform X1 [Diorhabda carinulata]|uniref:uncharacterized protein DDB_G0283697-like isoform X1 n=1 Tax=Diorhabda carinulata TaxID=1163345 RepID=UPI0025A13BD4|nr:uncharacterized protein DDB_G0283697-like isoform X1 [Diorhabda carinulata]